MKVCQDALTDRQQELKDFKPLNKQDPVLKEKQNAVDKAQAALAAASADLKALDDPLDCEIRVDLPNGVKLASIKVK